MRATDHDYDDALRALSVPNEATAGGVSRRRFLEGLLAAGVLAAPVARSVGRAAATSGLDVTGDTNLVIFTLGGGNDGLATVMPVGPSPLDVMRPDLLVPAPQLLPLGDGWGLHPALPNLHHLWQGGDLAVVGGVAASGSLSHLDSVAEWFCAAQDPRGGRDAGTGFVGRWLDALPDADDVPLRAVALTVGVPTMLVGHRTAGCGMPTSAHSMLGADRTGPVPADLLGSISGLATHAAPGDDGAHALVARLAAQSLDLAGQVGPIYEPELPSTDPSMVQQATLAARLLTDPDLGCRVVFCSFGSFDHHRALVTGQAATLAELDAAVGALFGNLDPATAERTVLLVHSEFGRRPSANHAGGTDHGTASYAFVAGPRVRGGHLYGEHPDLDHLDADGNPPIGVRHLDLLGTVMERWMGADASELLGGRTEDLGLFHRLEGAPASAGRTASKPV